MKIFKKLLSTILIIAILLPGLASAAPADEKVELKRLAGKDRAATAVATSKEAYPNGTDAVVLAGFKGEVDALTGTLLASDKEAPVLLTHKDKLTDVTKGEIKRLKPKTVYILGGEAVVSTAVENELKKNYTLVRVQGKDRFETAVKIAEKVKTKSDDVFLALGVENLADALAIGPASARNNIPVLLTKTGELPKETIKAMEDLKVKNVTIIGGKAAVSDRVKTSLEKKYKVDRVYGNTRKNTALSVAKTYFGKRENIVIAYGRTYADALVGGYLGAKKNAPILLTNDKGLNKDTEKYIASNPFNTSVLGGEGVISKATFNRIKQLLNKEVDESNPAPDGSSITRGEWVKLLSQKLSISPMELGEDFSYFYGDTEDSEVGAIIETANLLGLLPQPDKEGPMFEANKPASREFAAFTLAKGMGFEGEYKLESLDLSQVKYPSEVGVIVQQKFLDLKENKFLPDENLVYGDKDKMFDRIDYFNDSLEIKESDFKDEVTFKEGVLEIENTGYTIVENPDGTFTVTFTKGAETKDILKGTVFTLPPSDDFISGVAFKVVTVEDSNGKLVLTCEIPEIEEVAKDIEFVGYGQVDLSRMEVANGVVVAESPRDGQTYGVDEFSAKSKGEIGGITLKFYEEEIGDSGITLSGDVEFTLPKIETKTTYKNYKLDELVLSVKNELKISNNIEYDFGFSEGEFDVTTGKKATGSAKNELLRGPVPIGTSGFSVDFILFLNVELDGTVSISYSFENTNGIQYKDGALRDIKDFKAELKNLEINADAKLGLGAGIKLTWLYIDIVGVDFHAGVGVQASYQEHVDVEPPLYCGEAKLYIYSKIELDEENLLVGLLEMKTDFQLSWEIYNKERSPWNLKLHMENRKIVDECSYEKDDSMEELMEKERAAGMTVVKGKIEELTHREILERQDMLDLEEAFPNLSKKLTILTLESPRELTFPGPGSIDGKPYADMVEMINLLEFDKIQDYNGKHVIMSIDPQETSWPGGVDLPLGEPISSKYKILGLNHDIIEEVKYDIEGNWKGKTFVPSNPSEYRNLDDRVSISKNPDGSYKLIRDILTESKTGNRTEYNCTYDKEKKILTCKFVKEISNNINTSWVNPDITYALEDGYLIRKYDTNKNDATSKWERY